MSAAAAILRASSGLRRNVALDLLALVGVGITTAVILALLPAVSRRGGLDPIGLALLASAPFVANVLGLFAGRLGPRTPRQLAVTRAGGALLLLVPVFLPVPLMLTAVAVGFWISLSFSNPIQMRLWGAMYPARERGRLIGMVTTGKAAAAGTAVLAGGIVADRIGGLTVIALAGMVGGLCALGSAGLRAPLADDAPGYSPRAAWRAFRGRPVLARVGTAQAFYGGGLIAAAPLYALVLVDRLSLSLAEIGLIGILASVATTLSCLAWGALADRRGAMPVMKLGSLCGLVSLVAWAIAPSALYLWVAAVLIGLGNAATDMGLATVLGEHTPLEDRGAANAGMNALTGARGVVAPFIACGLVQWGVLSVTGALVACAICTGIGALLFLRLTREGEARAWSAVLSGSGVDRSLRRARALVLSAAFRG